MANTKTASASVETKFVDIADGPRHSLGITGDGNVYSWGSNRSSNNLGQLGRNTSKNKKKVTHPGPVQSFNDHNLKATKVFVSNSVQKDSGHSAIVDENGRLWMSGCDRWQQLGLGSVNGGSAGYTWKGGKLWQEKFMLSESVTTEIAKNINNTKTSKDPSIRDVALGEDHTLVLSSNKQDVFAFGKCGDGQCGFIGKPYVSAPRRSKVLSSGKSSIAAVCAIESCSMTIDDDGNIVQKVGKCTPSSSESASASPSSLLSPSVLSDGIEKCINDARQHGLINETEGSQN